MDVILEEFGGAILRGVLIAVMLSMLTLFMALF